MLQIVIDLSTNGADQFVNLEFGILTEFPEREQRTDYRARGRARNRMNFQSLEFERVQHPEVRCATNCATTEGQGEFGLLGCGCCNSSHTRLLPNRSGTDSGWCSTSG
jgi:hypothetical protein